MALFEHVIILKQSLSSNELSNELKNHTEMLSELNGNVIYNESWGMRNLAYPIKDGIPVMLPDEARKFSDEV